MPASLSTFLQIMGDLVPCVKDQEIQAVSKKLVGSQREPAEMQPPAQKKMQRASVYEASGNVSACISTLSTPIFPTGWPSASQSFSTSFCCMPYNLRPVELYFCQWCMDANWQWYWHLWTSEWLCQGVPFQHNTKDRTDQSRHRCWSSVHNELDYNLRITWWTYKTDSSCLFSLPWRGNSQMAPTEYLQCFF